MPTPDELKDKFWKSLGSDMTMMVGLTGKEDGHVRPMTAQLDGGPGPIWFFTSSDTALAQNAEAAGPAMASFASKGHDIFATVHGRLGVDTDRATLDRLWNRFAAAWFEGGKDDPKLRLLRLDPEEAEIWLDDSSFLAGIKVLLGADPKRDYQDNTARVRL